MVKRYCELYISQRVGAPHILYSAHTSVPSLRRHFVLSQTGLLKLVIFITSNIACYFKPLLSGGQVRTNLTATNRSDRLHLLLGGLYFGYHSVDYIHKLVLRRISVQILNHILIFFTFPA